MAYNTPSDMVPMVRAIATGIDLTTAAGTTIYTVPTGKDLIITSVIFELTNSANYIAAPHISFGTSTSGYANWANATIFPASFHDTFNTYDLAINADAHNVMRSGDAVGLDVTVPANALDFLANIYLIGFFI